ncbi:MAG: protein kinase domain-containing protein [Terriglobia bacterium]
MSSKVQQRFGKYEIIGELGQGGMGVVYKARDPVIGRLVALKTLTAEVLADPDLLKRFYREAQSAGSLQHPNIVTIYDMGESEGRPYIAMEYVEGESLQKVIARRQSLPLALKLKIISQFCQGLDHAHKHGVVHRDVKPGNILVKPDGVVKVVDFGIAHLDSTTLTKTGVFMGTVNYSSPEQLNDGHVDVRSDLWSVAVVMYELLTYHKPFEGANFATLISKILNTEPEPMAQYYPGIPAELDALVSRCLQKDPARRPQGLDEVLLDLAPIEQMSRRTVVSELVTEAQQLRSTGDLAQAQERVRSVLMLDSTHAEAKSLMSQITEEIRRIESSSRLIQLANEAERLLNQDKLAEALTSIDEALKLSPADPRILDLRGRIEREQQNEKAGREAFAAGHKAFKMGDLTVAESELRKALQLDPKNGRASSLLGIIHEDRSTRAKSFDLKEAIWDAENRLNAGDPAGAVERLSKLRAAHPGNDEIRRLLETAEKQLAAARAQQESKWLDEQMEAAGKLVESKDFDQATRVLAGVKNRFPNVPRVQQMLDLAETQLRAPGPAAPLPGVSPVQGSFKPAAVSAPPPALRRGPNITVIVVAAVIVLALAGAFIIHDLNHHQTPTAATPQQLQLERQAKQLVEQGQPDQALSLWSILAAQPGPLQAEAGQQVEQITTNSQQEKTLFAQAQAAQQEKNWGQALSLYQRVAALNGDQKNAALQAITNVKALQSGQDPAVIERQKFAQAQQALRRQDYTRARDLFQQVVNLNVANSTLMPQAQSELTKLDAQIKAQQDFNAAAEMQSSGQLAQAEAKFQDIVNEGGPLAAQAKSRLTQINQQLSAQQKKQSQAQALQASQNQFKDFESHGEFRQARSLLGTIGQQGGNAAPLESELDGLEQQSLQKLADQFNQASGAKNAAALRQLAPEFQSLAAQGGPSASTASDYALNRIPATLQQIAAAQQPSKPAAPAPAAPGHAAQVTVLTSGTYRPYNGPIRRGQLLPEYNIDGGLKAVSLGLPAISGAPSGSVVILKVNIDESGNVTPDHVINDTSGQGPSVLAASSRWKFQPPEARGKPVKTSVAVEVKF